MKIFCLLVTLILTCNVCAADLTENAVKLILIHPIQNYIELKFEQNSLPALNAWELFFIAKKLTKTE